MSISTEKTGGELTAIKLYETHARKHLEGKGVLIGEPIMAPRQGTGRPGEVELMTNVYAAPMKNPIKVYRYDVNITGIKMNGRMVEFTKKFKDDYTQTERRFRCRDVIKTFMNNQREFSSQAGCMYNDLQSIMYTLQPMAPQGTKLEFKFAMNMLHNSEQFAPHRLTEIVLLFTPVTQGSFEMELKQIRQTPNLLFANRDLAQFLDIATSQEVFFTEGEGEHVHFSTSNSYLYDPFYYGFGEEDMATFEENQTYLAIGCEKAIHTVQGPPSGQLQHDVGVPALVVQPKKTPFHSNTGLYEKVSHLMGPNLNTMTADVIARRLEPNLKGLVVQTSHNPNFVQTLMIKGIEAKNANQQTFEITDPDGRQRQMTVADYFRDKYRIALRYPQLPLIITEFTREGNRQKNYYPIELLNVCDNQRVKTQQLTPAMVSQAIKKCAVPPFILRQQVEKTAKSLKLWGSHYLQSAKIEFMRDPLHVQGRQLQNPTIGVGRQTIQPGQDGKWRAPNYYLTSNGPNQMFQQYGWSAFVFLKQNERFGPRDKGNFEKLVDEYYAQANVVGIKFPQPAQKEVIWMGHDYKQMEDCFNNASNNQMAFLLCFHADNDDQTHHEIKANERRYHIVTQCIRIGTANNVVQKGQRLTMQNILHKTNVKLGGLNFTLPNSRIASDMDTLVIGFSTNHPAGGLGPITGQNDDQSTIVGAPSVVGFAANVGPTKMPFDFIGDFLFQQSRREEKVNLIEDIVTRCLKYFTTTRGGKLPERVILYRNGCSEGQFQLLLRYEVPALKKALVEHNCDARLTMIVPNKLQNVRFFNKNINGQDKASQQNLRPGVVIDTTVVHPVFAEFFLNSHCALQGTARTPKYTVIYDDSVFQLDVLEQMTHDLCFGHQIVASPLSLPAPVRIALEYAKRGRNLYNTLSDELRTKKGAPLNYDDLNDALSFYGNGQEECWLAEYRVNA